MSQTIADGLSHIIDAKTNIDNTITAKGGVVSKGLINTPTDIATIPSGGGGGSSGNDVIFYDYDGSVVTSYSATDFANLSAMPANPSHTGLTAQGWNWSLADAKAYVASYGKLNIGQMYITSDGKTRLYITLPKNYLDVSFRVTLNENTELDIDWGDGSTHTTWTSNDGDSSKTHEYASAGRYVIAITVVTGEFYFSQALFHTYKVEIGDGVVGIGNEAFNGCYLLLSITIPDGVVSIGDSAFYDCYALKSITIPNSVADIDDSAFYDCYGLSSVTIPNRVTSIGVCAFDYCYPLSSITIPNSVTSIGVNAFDNCHALSSITIPDSVTDIGEYAFYYCYSLSSITIPEGVTSIGSSAFSDCYGLSLVTFESSTPPELYGDLGIPYTCIIRIPQGSLEAYTSASNYPDPSEYIYEEY